MTANIILEFYYKVAIHLVCYWQTERKVLVHICSSATLKAEAENCLSLGV